MRIKQLQLSGFKSFLDKTNLMFDVPITGIVGPNGCGKSNVVDALKWVTGEMSYKQLRGKNSEDLIFAGSDRRPPSSMMEVSLTLDNEAKLAPPQYNEFSEITVLRRIFRDGSSEFAINKTPCRLRDITDLFLDTGIGQSSYSIIEQGKVGMIVSGRPEDRRLMIEEAAGITKYKHRKKAALRKMDSTKQNLLRVSDIVKELEKQIASLERQAKKAEKFRVAKDEFEALDLQLSAYEYQEYQSQKETLLSDDERMQDGLMKVENDLSSIEADFESKRVELDELEKVFQNSQQELFSKKTVIQTVEHEIDHCKSAIAYSETQKTLDEEKIAQLERNITTMDERVAVILEDLAGIETSKQEIQTNLEQKKGMFDQHKEELSEIETTLDQVKSQHVGHVTEKTEFSSKIESLKNVIRSVEKEMHQVNEDLALTVDEMTQKESDAEILKVSLDEIQQMCFGFKENQENLENQLADTEAEKIKIEEQLSEVSGTLQEKESRLNALIDFTKSYQGYTKTVQNIMKRHHSETPFSGVRGVLGELIHIEEGFEKCVEASLSDWIESIVIDGSTQASELIGFLKEEEKARALLLTSDVSVNETGRLRDSRVVGTLDQWVRFEGDAHASVVNRLRSVHVVENLSDLIELSNQNPDVKIVSKDGDYAEGNGMLHVGPWTEGHGDLEVRQEIDAIKEFIKPLQTQKRELTESKELIDVKFKQAKDHLIQVQEDIDKENKKSSEISMQLQKMVDAVGFLTTQKTQRLAQVQGFKDKIEQADTQIQEKQKGFTTATEKIQELEATIEQRTNDFQQSRESFEAYQKEIHTYQIDLTSKLEKLDSLQREKAQTSESLSSAKTEKENLGTQLAKHQENIQLQNEKIQELDQKMNDSLSSFQGQEKENSELKIKHDTFIDSIRTIENGLKDLRRSKESEQAKVNDVRVRLSEIAIKMENTQEQVREIYERDLLDCIQEFSSMEEGVIDITTESFADHKQNRDVLKTKVQKFGNVNLAALDEIGELQERFEFLTVQQADLEKSLETLMDAIKTINKTTREKFETTYNEVNERFQKIFPRLFRGGKAKLNMTDPENVLETGVDIFAQPPGKKLQNMNLLSGGEKALTAISLLFAIFEYKAPPFCVLDEVDAPLDDANVLRYVSMVKEMSENTQFIVVTHNKSTMQMAKNLYGVTMEEPGVSRTVSVRLEQENVHDQETIFEAKSVA